MEYIPKAQPRNRITSASVDAKKSDKIQKG